MPLSKCCARLCCLDQENVEEKVEFDTEPCSTEVSKEQSCEVMVNVSTTRWNIGAYADDFDFNELLKDAEIAIENEILPVMIEQGSSGSYFVKNIHRECIGVFKPKDEEPYGRLNPKWAKWFQRHCCPCCFGRGCLIPNSGYLSEGGAYIVDVKLELHVVPKTKVIRMASSTFHYGKIRREAARAKKNLADRFPAVGRRFHRVGLPLKVGSFQTFVKGYKDASQCIQIFAANPLPEDIAHEFQLEFERLVILDYVIRNTDRGNDNWLIRYEPENGNSDTEMDLTPFLLKEKRHIKIAAIDNGLAFPFKHPDQWRTYPFHWARLSYSKEPFSEETKVKYLPILSNACVIEELCSDLYDLFSLAKHFHKNLFDKQMSVLRGQVLNLVNALRDGKTPFQLAQMPPVIVLKTVDYPDLAAKHLSGSRKDLTESTSCQDNNVGHPVVKFAPAPREFSSVIENYKPEFPHDSPIFSSW